MDEKISVYKLEFIVNLRQIKGNYQLKISKICDKEIIRFIFRASIFG
jgi:hypothetical protein